MVPPECQRQSLPEKGPRRRQGILRGAAQKYRVRGLSHERVNPCQVTGGLLIASVAGSLAEVAKLGRDRPASRSMSASLLFSGRFWESRPTAPGQIAAVTRTSLSSKQQVHTRAGSEPATPTSRTSDPANEARGGFGRLRMTPQRSVGGKSGGEFGDFRGSEGTRVSLISVSC